MIDLYLNLETRCVFAVPAGDVLPTKDVVQLAAAIDPVAWVTEHWNVINAVPEQRTESRSNTILRAFAEGGPQTTVELSARTGIDVVDIRKSVGRLRTHWKLRVSGYTDKGVRIFDLGAPSTDVPRPKPAPPAPKYQPVEKLRQHVGNPFGGLIS